MDTEKTTKKCTRCGRELPTTDFYANNRNKDGLTCYCKKCHNELTTQYRKGVVQRAKNKSRQEILEGYTPRELMIELKRRGYEGKLQYIEVHNIDISTL